MPTATKASVPTTIARIGISITKRLRDGGDPRDVFERSRAQAMSEPEEGDDDEDGDREREQPRDRMDDQEQAFDDRDPDRDRHPALAEPPAEAALAVLDDAWLEHAATLPSRRRQPGRAAVGEELSSSDGLLSIGEEPVDRRAGSRDVRAEGAGGAKLLRERRGGEVVRRQRGEVAGFERPRAAGRAARRSRRSPLNAA